MCSINKKYKLRCRKKGIVVDFEENFYKYDIVWKRNFNPDTSPIDKITYDTTRNNKITN